MRLDPRVNAMLTLAWLSGRCFKPEYSVAKLRKLYADSLVRFGPQTPRGAVTTREVAIPTDDGAINGRLYTPAGASAPLPMMLFFHGGGYVLGDVESYDRLARFLAHEGRVIVLSVDYRLAPEHRFPRAFLDGFAALKLAQEHASEFGADPARVGVGGDSAGGGIAAALSAYATERGLVRPAFQLLIYPAVDGAGTYESLKRYSDPKLPLTAPAIKWFVEQFLSDERELAHPLLTPLRAPSPELLPPTYLLAAAYDPLVDEGRAYAARLRAAGVPLEYVVMERLPHAFANAAGAVPSAQRALREAIVRVTKAARMHEPRSIFITGGASGIGRAVAKYFAARGWRIGIADVDEGGLEETAAALPAGMVERYVMDVRDRDAWRSALDAFTARSEGRLDVLFNNAGIGHGGRFETNSFEEIDRVVGINLVGVMNGARIGYSYLARSPGSCLLNTASASAIYGSGGLATYSATKFGVRGLSEALDLEWYPLGVKVRVLIPSFIETPLLDGIPEGGGRAFRDSVLRSRLELTPVEVVAQAAWDAVHGDAVHTYVGKTAKSMAVAVRLQPKKFRRLMRRTAAKFTERT